MRLAGGTARFFIWCLIVILWLWAIGALYFMDYLPSLIAVVLAATLLAGTVVAFARLPDRRRTSRAVLVLVAAVAVAWLFVRPSNDRDWSKDQIVLPSAELSETSLAMKNIRRVVLESGEVSKVGHFDGTYELNKLSRIWFGVEYFTKRRSLAHTFVTFEFTGQPTNQYLTFSIEIRREAGEAFDPLSGAFRRYEIMYVVSEEREMIENRLITSEDRFYLYPIRASEESRRALLADMVERMNRLKTQPEFYNSFTNNCTNNLVRHLNHVTSKRISPYSLKVIFPGFSDRLAYELGLMETDLSFDAAREHYRIDVRGRELIGQPDFSGKIRERLQ